jgi:hypothetical protein
MIKKLSFKIQNSSEAGVTMLLAVLIMSGLTLIATTLAFLAVNQIRASRAALVTEPAYLAAKTGGEEALWKAKRSDDLSTLPDCSTTPTSQSISSSNSYNTYCKSFGAGTYDLTAANTSSNPVTVLIYDPDDPNGNNSLLGMSPKYTTLTFTYKSGFSSQAQVARLDGSSTGLSASSCNVSSASPTCQINITDVSSSSDEGRILISLTASGAGSVDVNTNRGLPSNLNIASSACSARKITLTNCSSASQEIYNRKVEIQFK